MYVTLGKKIKTKWNFFFSKLQLHNENNRNNKNVFTFLIFYLLFSCFFFSNFTFDKVALCFIIFKHSLCSNTLTLERIFEYIRQNFLKKSSFIPGWNFISAKTCKELETFHHRQGWFYAGQVSYRDEISCVNTLLVTIRFYRHYLIYKYNFTWSLIWTTLVNRQ